MSKKQLKFPFKLNKKTNKWLDIMDGEQHIRYTNDILAISCYCARFNISYLDDVYADSVEQQDLDLAADIKKYYRDKLTLIMLKGKNFSNYRKSLYNFVSDSYDTDTQYSYPTSMIGMICMLPYFYKYDKEIEKIFGTSYRKLNLDVESQTSFYSKQKITLTFVNKIHNESTKNKEYWFITEHQDLLLVPVSYSNPLEKLFHEIISKNNNILDLDTFFEKKARDDLEFLLATHWTL